MTPAMIWDHPSRISSGKGQFVVNEQYPNRVNWRFIFAAARRARRNRGESPLCCEKSRAVIGRKGL